MVGWRCAMTWARTVFRVWLVGCAQGALVVAALAQTPVGSPSAMATDSRRSGLSEMSPAAQALQRDDTQNPAMLSVAQGRALWQTPPSRSASGSPNTGSPQIPTCAACHGELDQAMRGVAARYPSWDTRLGRVLSLGGRIAHCREQHQHEAAWPAESVESLAVQAAIALASRGQVITVPDQPQLARLQDQGEALWRQPFGQLALSCAQCHDGLAGLRLGGSPIPQGHPTAYPVYRLQWEAVGSLERRIRACFAGVRAEPFPAGDPAYLALEAYLMRRAAGMPLEGPGVRP